MALENKEEVYKLFGRLAEKIKEDKALYDKLATANLICGLQVSNLNAFITVSAKNSQMEFEFGESSTKPEATVSANDDIFVKFWQGKVNMMTAMGRGQLKVSGAVASVTKLLPRLSGCFPKWVEVLKEAGRSDLIVK